jgi:hypothetical protein
MSDRLKWNGTQFPLAVPGIGKLSQPHRTPHMQRKLADIQLWQRSLASLIRSGLFERADTSELNGLHTVVGIYGDGTTSAALAKYADARRAHDAASLTNVFAGGADRSVPIESN